MIISYAKRFIFVKGRKVAGTSLEVAVSAGLGPDDVITPNLFHEDVQRYKDSGTLPRNFMKDRDIERTYCEAVTRAAEGEAREPTGAMRLIRTKSLYVNHSALSEISAKVWSNVKNFDVVTSERHPYEKFLSLAGYRCFKQEGRRARSTEESAFYWDLILGSGYARFINNTPLYSRDRQVKNLRVLRFETLADDYALWAKEIGALTTLSAFKSLGGTASYDRLGDRRRAIRIITSRDFTELGYQP